MIHQNSRAALESIAPLTGAARIEVLRIIRNNGPITRQDIGLTLGWEINRVTGRVRELLDKNKIIEDGDDTSHPKARRLLKVAL